MNDMINRIDQELSFDQTALNLRAYRQELLASNIANADTPNYKARDLDFRAILNKVADSTSTTSMTKTQPMHIDAPVADSDTNTGVKFRQPLAPSLDGNTVDMQIEQASFAEASIRYQSSLAFATDTFRGLMLAITGQGQ